MADTFVDNYKSKHRHPLNKLAHSIGIPMIVMALPMFFFTWRWALVLFIVGWIFQFVGHAIEGNQPAFFRNPLYLLVGPWWLIRRTAEAIGLLHSSPSKQLRRQGGGVGKAISVVLCGYSVSLW